MEFYGPVSKLYWFKSSRPRPFFQLWLTGLLSLPLVTFPYGTLRVPISWPIRDPYDFAPGINKGPIWVSPPETYDPYGIVLGPMLTSDMWGKWDQLSDFVGPASHSSRPIILCFIV